MWGIPLVTALTLSAAHLRNYKLPVYGKSSRLINNLFFNIYQFGWQNKKNHYSKTAVTEYDMNQCVPVLPT